MRNKSYHLIDTLDSAVEAFTYLHAHEGITAVDTETTSANSHKCELLGISVSVAEGEAFYFPFQYYTVDTNTKERIKHHYPSDFIEFISSNFNQFLTKPTTNIIMHNAAFDVIVLRRTLGIDCLPTLYADTMLMKHTVYEKRPHGLKECLQKYLGEEWVEEQTDLGEEVISKGGAWTKTNKEMFLGSVPVLAKYAMTDADGTLHLFKVLYNKLEEKSLLEFYFVDEVHPLTKIVINDMIGHGVAVDLEYTKAYKQKLERHIELLEAKAYSCLKKWYKQQVYSMEAELLSKNAPISPGKSSLLTVLLENTGITPVLINGKPSFTKKVMLDLYEDYPDNQVIKWKLGLIPTEEFINNNRDLVDRSQVQDYLNSSEQKTIINLHSTTQLATLLYDKLGLEPAATTETGKPKVDEEEMSRLIKKFRVLFLSPLLAAKKCSKLLSTYVEGILEYEIDGIVRAAWKQHGTETGRLSAADPNLMNLPRDNKTIKYAFKARPGYKIVSADHSQLEPRIFSHLSTEESLLSVYRNGGDFYGQIAIDVLGVKAKDSVDVKKNFPKERQIAKTVALSVAYGSKRWKLAKTIGCSEQEADLIIRKYWKGLPNLKKFVLTSQGEGLLHEYVRTETGRIRHLDGIQKLRSSRSFEDQRIYNSLLNVCVNTKVQGLAASVVNRNMVLLDKLFKEHQIDGHIILQVHDEIVCEVREDQAELASQLLKKAMEEAYTISIPLVAEPVICDRLSETK